MQLNKQYIKQLIGQNRLEEAVEKLILLIDSYLSKNKNDKVISKLYDALLINSGKLNELLHNENLGILQTDDKKVTKAEIQKAVLYITDQMPEKVFNTKIKNYTSNYQKDKTKSNSKYFILAAVGILTIVVAIWQPWKNKANSASEFEVADSIAKVKTEAERIAEIEKNGEVVWQTDTTGYFIDQRDQHKYKVVKIGEQIWMAENLKATKYNDGTPIPNLTPNSEWTTTNYGAYCWYENNEKKYSFLGVLYNWFTIKNSKLAPKGWRIPSDEDWISFIEFINKNNGDFEKTSYGYKNIGKLIRANSALWYESSQATDIYGFSVLPCGYRSFDNGTFGGINYQGFWWADTQSTNEGGFRIKIDHYDNFEYSDGWYKRLGNNVRCIKSK